MARFYFVLATSCKHARKKTILPCVKTACVYHTIDDKVLLAQWFPTEGKFTPRGMKILHGENLVIKSFSLRCLEVGLVISLSLLLSIWRETLLTPPIRCSCRSVLFLVLWIGLVFPYLMILILLSGFSIYGL